MMSNDMELICLEAEVKRLTAYVAPHEMVRCWVYLASVVLAVAAAVFVLAGVLLGEVGLASLLRTTLLAIAIVYALTWKFRWNGRVLTINGIVRTMAARAIAVPEDLEEARSRLILCKARIAQLKRSRR